MVEIITQWPGRATEEVERLITVPVEVAMNGIPNLKVVRSISLYGLSDVIMTFADGTDPYFARQEAFQRMGDATLPSGVQPAMSPLSAPSGLVYRYYLTSPDRSPMELKTIDDWTIIERYKAVPGVADMAPLGGPTMQYQVLIDPTKLAGPASPSQWSRPRSAPTTTTPAAASTPRAASSTISAAWAGS